MRRQLVERELTSVGPSRRAPQPGGRRVTVNLAESPLTWLHSRGHLSDAQFDAGERLRADWERAQIAPGITMRQKSAQSTFLCATCDAPDAPVVNTSAA